uniref:DM10 domain-containing protein n=1 Tax=Chromulina nebulosa TaxID=96789 RepID=A0A7S0XFR9_9STRA|mmetsp:Transcript_861/g.751  ORF Transcript_861/g.751 Transcript_861/m.751 type:complete len:820 (+) Transcript_861:64-2523(+)
MSNISLSGDSQYDSFSSSSISALTMVDLPNLPGIRSRIATINPKIYKQYIDYKGIKTNSLSDEHSLFSEDNSLIYQSNQFDNHKSLVELTRSISAYPPSTSNYNDLSSRYSLKSKSNDQLNHNHLLPYTNLTNVPSYIQTINPNGKICRFEAYFNDSSKNNLIRTRIVNILYYLIDDTIEIIEPKVNNSGSIEGKLLKRHKIKKINNKKSYKSLSLSPVKSSNRSLYSSPSRSTVNSLTTSPIKPLTSYSNNRVDNELSISSSVSSLTLNESDYYTIHDFHAGAELNFYNTIYTIMNCDNTTLNYFNNTLNQSFGSPISIPNIQDIDACYISSTHGLRGKYNKQTNQLINKHKDILKLSTSSSNYTLESKQFFEYDKLTLRFYGVWDNRDHLYGDVIHVCVHYRLADDTIEIIPDHHYVNEKHLFTDMKTILKSTKIYKDRSKHQILFNPDFMNKNLSINVADHITSQITNELSTHSNDLTSDPSTYLSPILSNNLSNELPNKLKNDSTSQLDNEERDFYHWSDFYIGYRLQITAVDILLYDADNFTRTFYQSNELELDDRLDYKRILDQKFKHKHETVYGTRRNSNATLYTTPTTNTDSYTIPYRLSLIPEQPHKDGQKLKNFQGMFLRFQIKFVSCLPCDSNRRFILTYHLEDDTVDIKEITVRNSGHIGGTFLYRSHVQNPATNKYLQPKDLYISAIVYINSSEFVVFDADDSTLHYMEHNCNQFIYSNIELIKNKLIDQMDLLKSILLTTKSLSTCIYTYDELEKLIQLVDSSINKQEVITLARYLNGSNNQVKLSKLLTIVTFNHNHKDNYGFK